MRIVIILILIILSACNTGRADVLPKEKMEKIMWEVAQSSEFLNGYIYNMHPEYNHVAVNDAMLDKICKINNVTKEQFNKSLEYYQKNPKILQEVLDSIIAHQQRQQNKPGQLSPDSSTRLKAPSIQ